VNTHLDIESVLALDSRVNLVPGMPNDELTHVIVQLDSPAAGSQDHGFDVFTFGIDQGAIEVEENGSVGLHACEDYTETIWLHRWFLLEPCF
jgi:hypothetical protein